jgi:flap endonuclease-1
MQEWLQAQLLKDLLKILKTFYKKYMWGEKKMGVKFKDIITPEDISFKDLDGKIIAIDSSNTLYQFLSSIRQFDGTPLMDNEGNITSHLSGILYRTSNIVDKGIKPIYVFDGKPSKFKENIISKRRETRKDAEKKWRKALEEGDNEMAAKFAKRTSCITPYVLESTKELLTIMGIPFVQSHGEGEAQASHMVANGDAWAVASQDYDCLLFGSPKIIRNLTISRNLSGLKYLESEKVLKDLDITREQLINIAILVGTDFNHGVKGVGAKTGLKIARRSTLEEYLKEKNISLEVEINELKNIFLNPDVNKNYKIKWKKINKEKIIDFMCNQHDFSKEKVLAATKKMKKINTNQKSLEDWFVK